MFVVGKPVNINMRFATTTRASILAVALVCGTSCQQDPAGRIWECIAPANPGGGWDLTCRSMARVVADLELGPSMMRVSNMPGAGGGVAYANAVTQRGSDENVVVAASPATTLLLAQQQYGDFSEQDVRWVGALGAEYGILAVRPDAPWADLGELMRAWKEDPSQIIVSGGSAVAGQDHMKVLLLGDRVGIAPRQIRYVAYDGGGEAMTALLGGFVHVFSGEGSEVEAQAEAGKIRILAVLSPERLEGTLAEVPTARESGYDVEWITWRGFYVPGQVSDAAYQRWVDVITKIGHSPEWALLRAGIGLQPFLRTGGDFEAFVGEQVQSFREMSREVGLIE